MSTSLWSSKSPVFQRIALHSGMSPSLIFSNILKLNITIAGKKNGNTGARKFISIYKIPIKFSNLNIDIKQSIDMNLKECLLNVELINGRNISLNIQNKNVEDILNEVRNINNEYIDSNEIKNDYVKAL